MLLICLLIQILDLSRLCIMHHNRVKVLTEYPSRLESSIWGKLDKDELFFFYDPVGGGSMDITFSLGKYAYDNNMVMNDFYTSRKNNIKINQDKEIEKNRILAGNADDSKIYVFDKIPIEFLTYETGLLFYEIDKIFIGITDKLEDQKEVTVEQGLDMITFGNLIITEGREDIDGIHICKDGSCYINYSRLPSGTYHMEYQGDNLDNAVFYVCANSDDNVINFDNMQKSDEKVFFDIILDNIHSDITVYCENTGKGEILLTDINVLSSKSNRKSNELHIGEIVSFMKSSYNANPFIKQGMSQPEEFFTWTEGREVQFSFLLSDALNKVHGNIEIVGVFYGEQEVSVFVNENEVFSGILREAQNIEFDFDRPEEGIVDIKLELPDAISPSEVSNSNDERQIALSIKTITFTDVLP